MHKIVALYKFTHVSDPESLRVEIEGLADSSKIFGGLIIADEGLNGTISGKCETMDSFLSRLQAIFPLDPDNLKFSYEESNPFVRLRIQIKGELISMGLKEKSDPRVLKGTYVDVTEWNDLLGDPEITIIDTRNNYEVEIGTFEGALNPSTENFKDFPAFVTSSLDPSKNKKIAMFCTGGIRCEKASSYLLHQGFQEVYHLKGGILKYLEEVDVERSKWRGECYVFDRRVSVGHGLQPGTYSLCRACRHPLTAERGDLQGEHYVEGVSCAYCHERASPKTIQRASERNLQMKLAASKNETHLGRSHPNS